MRISELVSMRLSRMRLEERAAIIIGKGRREEWVFWNVEAGNAVQLYLNVRCSQDDQLWRRNSGLAMTPYDVRQEIIKLENAAGIELPEGATVHCFRHRFAHKAIESGLDVSQTSQLMRHRDIASKIRYLREIKEDPQAARDKIATWRDYIRRTFDAPANIRTLCDRVEEVARAPLPRFKTSGAILDFLSELKGDRYTFGDVVEYLRASGRMGISVGDLGIRATWTYGRGTIHHAMRYTGFVDTCDSPDEVFLSAAAWQAQQSIATHSKPGIKRRAKP
jgi:hypothetical protein